MVPLKAQNYESRMEVAIFRCLLNVFLTAIIYYLAKLSSFLGLPDIPLAISAVWPATGFALAAILLFGNKAFPGVIAGNFLYNFVHLYSSQDLLIIPILISLTITVGSALEAYAAAYVLRRFTSPPYFSSVKDIIIFLIPAALLGSMLAATIGTFALFLYAPMSWGATINLWLAFAIGDLMGVYIFTPLLVVWATTAPTMPCKVDGREISAMVFAFFSICYLSNALDYPMAHFYILLTIWIAYRFRLHGATLSILAISLATIIPTSIGIGSFVTTITSDNRLLILVTFLEIVVAVSLLLAALVNEREAVVSLLEHQNVDLRESIDLHIQAVKEMARDVIIKQKLSSFGVLTSKIADYLHKPLSKIDTNAQSCLKILHQQQKLLQPHHDFYPELLNLYEAMENHLNLLCSYQNEADTIATIIQEQTTLSAPKLSKARMMHINTLLNICLNETIQEITKHSTDFTYTLTKDFDRAINTFILLPEDLVHVFNRLFNHAFLSMKEKKEQYGLDYRPELSVQTINHDNSIEIIIQDNGLGMTEESVQSLFQSFIQSDENNIDEIKNIGLALVNDILTKIYRGSIQVSSIEGSYFKCNITLPKEI